MQDVCLKLYAKMRSVRDALAGDERGQDLIEYALVVAIIALAAVTGMSSVATAITGAFTKIGQTLTTYTTS